MYGSASTVKEHAHHALQGRRMGLTAGHCDIRCIYRGISPIIVLIAIVSYICIVKSDYSLVFLHVTRYM